MDWRGFGFVHRSRANFCRAVPNPNITIRNFFIAVPQCSGVRRQQQQRVAALLGPRERRCHPALRRHGRHLTPASPSPTGVRVFSKTSERSVATPQAVRGWSRAPCSHFKNPSCAPCSHFKIPSCAGLESAFERAMGKPFQRQRLKSQVRADEGGTQTTRPYEGYVGGGGRWVRGRGERW